MQFESPQPGPEHEALSALCGEWVGDETMMPSPYSPGHEESTCELSVRMLEGFFVISDYVQRRGGEVSFRGHGVYSWDPQASCYKMYWFDSMGGAGGVAEGHVEDNVLTFKNQSPMGHHMYRYTFDNGETRFEMAMSQDGEEWQMLMEGHYRPK